MAAHGGDHDEVRPGPDAPALERAGYAWGRLENALNLIAGLSIFGIMIVGVVQIVTRSVSSGLHDIWPAIQPFAISGYIDWIEFIAVLYALLGIAYCQRLGGHIRMEIALASIKGRARWALECFGVALTLGITLLLTEATFENFLRAYLNGDSSMDIRLPLWPSKLVVPLALAVLAVRLALQLWGYLRLLIHPHERPIGVPLVLTPDEAAQQEIEEIVDTGRGA